MPPTVLIDSLQGIRRKVKWLSVAFGAGLALAVFVGSILATVLIDYLLNLPVGPRLLLILASLVALGYVASRWILRPLVSRLTLRDVAARLEEAFPQFEDRLRSTVDFLDGQVPGSDSMKQQVVTETAALARQVDLNRAVVMRPVWYSVGAAAGAVALATLLSLAVSDQYLSIALSRLLTPFDAQPWPKTVEIALLDDVPTRVPVGQRIDVRMKLTRGDKASLRPILFYQYDDGPVQRELMTRGDDGAYVAALDAKMDGTRPASVLNVWMKAGDDDARLEPISVVPRLAIVRAEAKVVPPPYAARGGAEPFGADLADGPVTVTVGSDVELSVLFNKPLAAEAPVVVEPAAEGMSVPPVRWQRLSGSHVAGSWTAMESLRFHVRATDADGFSNVGLEEYELVVRPDQTPVVQIEHPRRNEERTVDAYVPLEAVAEDDFDVTSLQLVVDRLGDKKHWEIDLVSDSTPAEGVSWTLADSSRDRRRFRMNYTWELARLPEADLKPGDVLEYHLRVRDNFDLDGQKHDAVESGRLRVAIISQQDLDRQVASEMNTLSGLLHDIRTVQVRTQGETQTLAEETEQKPQFDAADRAAAERVANQQSTVASQTNQIAGKLEGVERRLEENRSANKDLKDVAREVNESLRQTAEGDMKEAASRINSAKDQKTDPAADAEQQQRDAQERNEAMVQAAERQQRAAEQLAQAVEKMGTVGTLQQAIDRLSDLLDEQKQTSGQTQEVGNRNLGRTPEQMSRQDREKLEELAREQKQLAERVRNAVREMEQTSESMKKSDPASSKSMKNAAETANQQQVAPNQGKAADAMKQNRQSEAQDAQKKAEMGLEMMISQLKEAEQRKLEQLNEKLAELQEHISNLIRRQAGHNLDNLTLQGPEQIAKLEKELADALLAKAERKPMQLVQPKLNDLNAGQEQTERNTRSVAQMAEMQREVAAAAPHLTRAAGKMERAIVLLRQKNLADAYGPPQVDALAALEEAKQVVDEKQAEVQQKVEQRKRDTIRKRYEQVKAKQEQINADTAKIDTSAGPDGQRNRAELIRLGQLPGEQGGLSDEAKTIGEDLAALGTVVYVWANNDIVESMNEVKNDLGKQKTGQVTQAEQARIVEQLDAMIRNLAIKPPDPKKFESPKSAGGSGSGNGQPQLPPVVELRLLKDLQVAVNTSTTKIDGLPEPQRDKAKLLGLGTRQGELRNLLDQLLRKASQNRLGLGPEPDNRDILPEESTEAEVEDDELLHDLLHDEPGQQQDVAKKANLVGDRMARSRQRLAINHDPGKTTQIIQKRILEDFDDLIEQAQQQQQQMASSSQKQQGEGEKKNQPDPGLKPAKAENQGKPEPGMKDEQSKQAARESEMPGGDNKNTDLSKEIHETAREWGSVSPRVRDAIIDGAEDKPVEKYQQLISDYYRSLAEKASEKR